MFKKWKSHRMIAPRPSLFALRLSPPAYFDFPASIKYFTNE